MSALPICDRLRALESASPDFLGEDEGRYETCFHRNPDGPAAADTIEALYEALTEIAKGEGPFSRDPLIHAENCIESMKDIAHAAIAKARGQ